MSFPAPAAKTPRAGWPTALFAALWGAFLGLALLKFGNPPITEQWVVPPEGIYEFLFGYPWPIAWAYGMLAGVAVLGAAVAHWRAAASRINRFIILLLPNG